MKLGQNVCLDEISDEFELGLCWFKNCVTSFKSYTSLKTGHFGSRCVCSRGHILRPIFMKLGQTICLIEISDEMEGKCIMPVQKLGH